MPYAVDPTEDEKKKQAEDGAPQTTTGDSGLAGSGGAAAASGEASAPGRMPSQSGRYTNLQSYLDASQGTNFGQDVAGKVSGEQTAADKAASDAEAGFKSDVDKGKTSYDDAFTTKTVANPTGLSAEDRAKFLKQRDATYGGPNALTDETDLYTPFQKARTTADEAANQTTTDEGRQALVKKYYPAERANRSQYTQGEQQLDNLLLSVDPGARSAFEGARNQNAASKARYGDLETALGKYAEGAKGETAETAVKTKGALTKAEADEQKAVNARVATRQGQYDTTVPALQKALQSRDISGLSNQDRMNLGLDSFGGGSIFNVDPSRYLNPINRDQITAGTVATPEEQARMAALSDLAGEENTYLPNAKEAGTMASNPLYNFNKGSFGADVGTQQGAYNGAVSAVPVTYSLGLSPAQQKGDLGTAITSVEKFIADAQAAKHPSEFETAQNPATLDAAIAAATKERDRLYGLREPIRQQYGYYNKFLQPGQAPLPADTGYIKPRAT